MKKYLIVFLFFLVTGCALKEYVQQQKPEEIKFKNAIFYERLEPCKGGPVLMLTPTYMMEDMYEDGIAEGPCNLLENEENHIIIQCKVHYPRVDEFRTYKNKYTLYPNRCWKVDDVKMRPAQEGEDRECVILKEGYFIPHDRIDGWSWYTAKQKR